MKPWATFVSKAGDWYLKGGWNKWRRRRERSKRGTEGERRRRKRRRTRRRSRVNKRRISGRNVIGGSSGLVLVLVAANLCNAKCSNHQRLLLRAADTAMNNELVPFSPYLCHSHSLSPSLCHSHIFSPSLCHSHFFSQSLCHSHFLSPSLCNSHFLTFHMIESDLANRTGFCFIF